MNITIVLCNKFPVSLYGGTERVMWDLGKALVSLGHVVHYLVLEKGGDCPFADLIEIDPNIGIYNQIPNDTDIVHLNEYQVDDEKMKFPWVITIHGNKVPETLDANSIFVSQNHARRFGCDSFVYNGLDWSNAPKLDLNTPRKYYHFLGKAAWSVKNVRGAIDVTKRICDDARLVVLGGYRLNFKMGFRFTFSRKISFKGMVNDTTKYDVMQKSKGLIFPVTWHEPFGLAVIESLYAGCPVFSTPYGSLPELVTDTSLGYLTNSAEEMVNAIRNGNYLPQHCHEYACEMFNAKRMAENYLVKYEKVLNGEPLIKEFKNRIREYKNLEWKK